MRMSCCRSLRLRQQAPYRLASKESNLQVSRKGTRMRYVAILVVLLLAELPAGGAEPESFSTEQLEFFETKIRPLLIDNCYTCHSANTNAKGGLRVDDRNGLLMGGGHGPAIVPGKPDESLLLAAVAHTHDDVRMPPGKQLDETQLADLRRWIEEGAAWPPAEETYELGADNPEYEHLRNSHWAWQPLADVKVPEVQDTAWPLSDIDRFVLARLEAEQLRPAPDADRIALIRRVTFDLTGLPPTPAEVDAFLADDSPEALARVVDRLLASPAFGEHWGRHWLDVARYGESTGSSRNLPYPHAWRYRDYVIRAWNADKPFDRFIHEQVAGDLLPAADQAERDELQVATGFLALGVKDVNQRFKVRFVMDNIDEQIDAVSRSFLALTVSCARCHDHKFDPIPASDYYALAGIFHSTDLCAGVRNKMGGGGLDYYDTKMLLRLGDPDETHEPDPETAKKIAETKAAMAEARAAFQALKGKPEGNEPGEDGRPKRAIARQKVNKLNLELQALTDPASLGGKVAYGVREADKIGDTQIRLRGEAEQLGPTVPRGFLSLVPLKDAPQIPDNQSGRLELAAWLTHPENPLTPRVLVNRIWRYLFGAGLVSSVDNFGVNGDTPSHPELLDYLARQVVQDGWSTKRLIRSLVLTRTYQLSSDAVAANLAVDPANRLLWRHQPRRLTAEELRDATLAAAGVLDLTPEEASPAKSLPVVEIPNNGPEASRLSRVASLSSRRSIYLPLVRGIVPRSLDVFDFADQGMVTGDRDETTVATQALYLLNDPFVRRQSLALASRLIAASADEQTRIELAYRLILGRSARADEASRASEFLAAFQSELPQLLAIASPEGEIAAPTVTAGQSSGGASESADAGGTSQPQRAKKAPSNPDEMIHADEPEQEEQVEASTPEAAAWSTFCQALLASAEFRYLP
jgi:hypothetical protein